MPDPEKYRKGIVVQNKHWTEQLFSLSVDVGIDPFVPGQFGRLALPIDGETVSRPYSFVNAPEEPIKEFYGIIVPQGPLSPCLAALEVGAPVWLGIKANGFLMLDEVPSGKHLWLISSGTGLGPFLSILKTQEPWSRFEKVILIHAVRTAAEATYRSTIEQCRKERSEQFMPIHFISRESVSDALPGRIPAAIQNGMLEEKAQCEFTAEDSQVMICGNPDMVKDVSATLIERKLTRNRRRTPGNITVEAYW